MHDDKTADSDKRAGTSSSTDIYFKYLRARDVHGFARVRYVGALDENARTFMILESRFCLCRRAEGPLSTRSSLLCRRATSTAYRIFCRRATCRPKRRAMMREILNHPESIPMGGVASLATSLPRRQFAVSSKPTSFFIVCISVMDRASFPR